MPFNKSNYFPLSSEKLDTLTKHFQQLRVLLVDEASLIGATFLYEIDKRLRQIKYTPTCYFGGIDIIFCGDLCQAHPIKDSFIFEEPTINNHKISYSFWQDEVKCYELHMTMRQKNLDFIRILKKLRLNKQSDEDIEYINAHCYRAAPIDPLFPYLFYRNKDVNEHNDRMLSIVNGQLVILETIDEVENYEETMSYYENTISLPIKILVKKNMLIELCAGNYNIEDGLVNGADGVFKKYTRKTKDIDIIWIDFIDATIGKEQRNTYSQLYDKDVQLTWTPILRIAKPNAIIRNKSQVTIRKQFPIQLACARTIHRTQGLTLNGLAFDPTGVTRHGLVYTTLSRVKTIDSLFLLKQLS